MEKICYVCGDVGFEELLVTCMNCEEASFHKYCMKTIETVDPNKAMSVCEACDGTHKHATRKFSELPAKKKIKIISTDEAIALASHSSLSKVAGKRHLGYQEKAYDQKVEVTKKRVESDTNVVRSIGDLRICSAEKRSALPSAEQKRYLKPPVVPRPSKQKSCAHARTPSPISKPSPEPRSSKESSAHAHAASTKSCFGLAQGGTSCKDTLKTSDNAGEERLSDKQLTIDRHLPNHPVSSAKWRGTLTIGGYDTPVGSCTDVWAYPPSKISKKAFEFSMKMQMQESLHFEPIPRSAVWGNMFDDRGPDEFDIGLYFLPIGDRSEHCYSHLISYLEKQDIALRCFICGIQILIFSSSNLEEESKKINDAYYLWGLFAPIVITRKEPAQNQFLSVTNTEAAIQHIPENEGPAGMETDVPVPIDSHPSCSKTNKVAASASQQISEIQVKLEKWDNDDLASLPKSSACAARMEPRIPPGFEKVKLKTISEILHAGED